MLIRFAYPAVTHAVAALRLLPMSDRDKDIEILALRHQITVLERHLGTVKPTSRPEERTFLAALLTPLPRPAPHRLPLLVQPDTVRCRHRNLMHRRHTQTCQPTKAGRPRTVRAIRLLVLRLVREDFSGYRRVHGELAVQAPPARAAVWRSLARPAPRRAPPRQAAASCPSYSPTCRRRSAPSVHLAVGM
ncbi:hypothetical protein [Streptomyces sp. NPDC058695]|uniref:hypothetical protein n=1 Tax=Streptomyces sp. NPDC058695 TaxID=3346604 RepID=UPI0036495E84